MIDSSKKSSPTQTFATLSPPPDWLREEIAAMEREYTRDDFQIVAFAADDPAFNRPRKNKIADKLLPPQRARAKERETILDSTMARHFDTTAHAINPAPIVTANAFGVMLPNEKAAANQAQTAPGRGVVLIPSDTRKHIAGKLLDNKSTPAAIFDHLRRALFIHEVGHTAKKQRTNQAKWADITDPASEIANTIRKGRDMEREADLFTVNTLMRRGKTEQAEVFLAYRTLTTIGSLSYNYLTSLGVAKAMGKPVPAGKIDQLEKNAINELIYLTDREERMREFWNDREMRKKYEQRGIEIERDNASGRPSYGESQNRKELAERIQRIDWLMQHRKNILSPEAKCLAQITLDSAKRFGLHPSQQKRLRPLAPLTELHKFESLGRSSPQPI